MSRFQSSAAAAPVDMSLFRRPWSALKHASSRWAGLFRSGIRRSSPTGWPEIRTFVRRAGPSLPECQLEALSRESVDRVADPVQGLTAALSQLGDGVVQVLVATAPRSRGDLLAVRPLTDPGGREGVDAVVVTKPSDRSRGD